MTAVLVPPPSAVPPAPPPSARHRRRRLPTLPAPPLLAAALVAGAAWGAATSGLQTVLPSPWAALANAVSPWVTAAFAVGLLSRRPGAAAAAGLLVCWGETTGYYGTSALRGFGVGATALVWLAAAVVGGPVFGVAGWAWQHARPRVSALGAATLAAVFVAEGAVVYAWVLGYRPEAVLFCSLGALVAVVLGLRRHRLRAVLAWCAVTVPLGAGGEALLVQVLG